jgi:hypothetical protein
MYYVEQFLLLCVKNPGTMIFPYSKRRRKFRGGAHGLFRYVHVAVLRISAAAITGIHGRACYANSPAYIHVSGRSQFNARAGQVKGRGKDCAQASLACTFFIPWRFWVMSEYTHFCHIMSLTCVLESAKNAR